MKKMRFDELGLSEKMLRAVIDMGFEEASPIQAEAIPPLLNGKDVIGQAQTGTGKTAAFAIPIIERIDYESKGLQALVLCPTRELVVQVTEEFRKLFKYYYNLAIVPVYGGQEIDRQINALKKKPQIVVGTPGRLMDHMRRSTIKLDNVRFVVLDEADEMLDMGFREDMEVILKDTPAERQTIMFSATMPDEIVSIMKHYQKNPVRIDVTGHRVNAPKIEQVYFDIQERAKPEALARLIDFHGIKSALVFCNTRMQVDGLVEILKNRGYSAEGLHGDMGQRQRDTVMSGFRKGGVEILVATDVAGRGIDVNDIEAVFNYDLPRDDEDYIHRIGRTGRAGKSGKAFTFIVGRQIYNLKRIERVNGIRVVSQKIPSLNDVDEVKIGSYAAKIKEIIETGSLGKYVNLVETLMGGEFAAIDVAAALLKLAIGSKPEGFSEKFVFESKRDAVNSKGGDGRSRGRESGREKGGFGVKKNRDGREHGGNKKKRQYGDKRKSRDYDSHIE